ncbi:hypothetical protein DFW101_1066 [Solidesulfovibrio carbinoliphilus subsp. oakridgensis]|uniref:Uncharacterized protein n=1 Tax=Solidesulfovibrio carbinoliphilus subsp. oakridgensis TaxID=694327 RepID=G7Q661_9BACT|nr:hypothetical protein [Solidesulfovibrio carbinoliphilus]EHJ47077.1 hypothetical protein DFW101_1066 [Solidesulfovibrio carbinoliphilus subsp. oakridgensis]
MDNDSQTVRKLFLSSMDNLEMGQAAYFGLAEAMATVWHASLSGRPLTPEELKRGQSACRSGMATIKALCRRY